ncbi:tubulin nucleotide-binding domain-like protein [Hortaea werneckii]|nr:tubulin nucleotide-binding domain-like protein [Hortaea werneckii]
MHEIVTLQFGQQANYIGTHYWNTQESYFTYAGQDESPINHDKSFRPGVGADGSETYSPRTLIYDLKGAFGTLRRENALYELQQQEQSVQEGGWSGSTMSLQLPPIAPSGYQQALDQGVEPPQLTNETVRFWSDYNHLFYHPRSIVQLNEYELNSSLMPFEKWATGEELFDNLDREHDLLDRDLRPFLEECDQLQALQILTSLDDAWGGFTAKYLERIADDLGKGCRWVFGSQDGQRKSREKQLLQVANSAQSLFAMNDTASMQIPLSSAPRSLPSYVQMDPASKWNTSALQAAAFESLTLPTRLRRTEQGHATFDELETTLSNEGNRKVGALGMTVKSTGSSNTNSTLNGTANGTDDDDDDESSTYDTDIDLLPEFSSSSRDTSRKPHRFSAAESLRGLWRDTEEIHDTNLATRDRRVANLRLRTSTHQSALLFPILPSYPSIFRFQKREEKLAVKTSLQCSTLVADRMRELERNARRMVGVEERETLCDGLATMAEEYEDGWSDDEDEDEGEVSS